MRKLKHTKSKDPKEEMVNLALLLISWGNYKPTTAFTQIKRQVTMQKIRERLAELNEQQNAEQIN